MMKRILLLLSIVVLVMSCSSPGWKVEGDSLLVYPTDSKTKVVKLEPFSETVIRVAASAKQIVDSESLVVLPKEEKVNFEVKEDNNFVYLTTKSVQAVVSKASGVVKFYDLDGNVILAEKDDNGRIFTPMQMDGEKAYELQQVFQSPGEEAIYGLGQHQAHDMNYKGKSEELFQYNTKVSIPFIVSTRNYGILWDNYSLTRYGDPRPFDQIDIFKLYNSSGAEGTLTATYIDDYNTNNVYTVREESNIDYENLETINNFPEGFKFDKAKITWEGEIEAQESGSYNFLMYYAGYTKIWVDGVLYAERWRTAWNPSVAKFEIAMEAGQKYPIKLEWTPDGGESYIGLKALSPRADAEREDISFYSEMGDQIDYYFMVGDDIDGVIKNYRAITGKAQVMPKWSLGFWQSRERYKTQDELIDVMKEFRKRKIPIDNIVQDWSFWKEDDWGSHEFDAARFPNPKGMVDKVHDLNGRLMISIWPKFYLGTDHYNQFDSQGWMYQRAIEDSIRDWIADGYIGSFYDAYAPGARDLFWNQIKEKLYSLGIDGWWLDATEPDILSNASIEYRKALMNPTYYGSSTKYFNAFALVNAQGIYDNQRKDGDNERVYILTRSGFAGMQRYGTVTWSGDIGTVWEDLKAQIPAGVNFAMSGLPYWTMDIGGFCVEKRYEVAQEGSEDMNEWRELNTRWFQFGTFVPIFRSHGQYPFREIFNIAPENHPAYKSMLYYNKLRYRLMPYIYSLAGSVYFDDYTIMRGLAMDYANDKNVYDIDDQYMFGPSLLISPIYEYKARERDIYFPEGKGWYDIYSGKYQAGGIEKTIAAPYEIMPIYAPAGSIIPFGPEIEYTTQKEPDYITLMVYTGADGSFTLYEDEGVNYNYEDGKYSTITFSYSEDAQTLTIGDSQGEYDGMLKDRKFNVVFVSKTNPVGIDNARNGIVVDYSGEGLEVVYK